MCSSDLRSSSAANGHAPSRRGRPALPTSASTKPTLPLNDSPLGVGLGRLDDFGKELDFFQFGALPGEFLLFAGEL